MAQAMGTLSSSVRFYNTLTRTPLHSLRTLPFKVASLSPPCWSIRSHRRDRCAMGSNARQQRRARQNGQSRNREPNTDDYADEYRLFGASLGLSRLMYSAGGLAGNGGGGGGAPLA